MSVSGTYRPPNSRSIPHRPRPSASRRPACDGRRAEGEVRAVVRGPRGRASTNSATRNGSLRGRCPATRGPSTPDATSTPTAGMARSAPATLAGSRPPARMTGTSRATAAASRVDARRPCRPDAGRRRCRGGARSAPAARYARPRDVEPRPRPRSRRPGSAARGGGAPSRSGRETVANDGDRFVAAELDDVGVDGVRRPFELVGRRSTVIATIAGAAVRRGSSRASRASAAASSSVSARGVPATTLSPIASAPARIAASTPASSVMPQIFTVRRRATSAGSSGGGAGSDERADARPPGSRRPHERLADERAIEAERAPTRRDRGVADARLGDHEAVVGDGSRSRPARSASTSSVRRSRLLRPMTGRPSRARARARARRGPPPAARGRASNAASTSRPSRFAGWRTASRRTRSAPAARSSVELARLDDEVLGQDRHGDRRADRAQVVDRAAEPVRLAQHRDRRCAARLVRPGPGDDVVVAGGDLPGGR